MKTCTTPDSRVQRVAWAFVEATYRARHAEGKEKIRWETKANRFYQWLAARLV